LLAILRRAKVAASNYQWSALSRTREDALVKVGLEADPACPERSRAN
jgi:hypothetical protein